MRWRDSIKDDRGYRAVFAEQGASASQVAAATFLDTISKLLGMACEYPLIRRSSCWKHQHYCDCQKRTHTSVDKTTTQPMTEHLGVDWSTRGSLERQRRPSAGLLWGKTDRRIISQTQWGTRINTGMSLTENHNCSCPYLWMTSKKVERKRHRRTSVDNAVKRNRRA